jgi:uncharacterized protein RhaS with RHS repeats
MSANMRHRNGVGGLAGLFLLLAGTSAAQAYFKPGLGRFISRDPIEEGEGGANLYRFVENNPANLIDPDGQKARVAVDPKNCTITVTMSIGIYGKGASSALATKITECIERYWNGGWTKVGCAKGDLGTCKVQVAVWVHYYPSAKHWWDVPEENQIKIDGATDRSSVGAVGGTHGHWRDDKPVANKSDPCWMFAHEAGHLIGLRDDYRAVNGASVPNQGHSGHMMGESGGGVAQHEIDGILQGKKCPKECCCPPWVRPEPRRCTFDCN